VPMTGGIALTHRCNLKCIHCYAGPGQGVSQKREPSTERWLSLIDEIVEAGCLFLLLTGGDPMVRPDFARIYRHAKESGMLVTVFTNGTLIDQAILDLFDELPPHVVEISIYGATAATHDEITTVGGSFARMIDAVEKLLDRGIRLRLKSILMKPNRDEFDKIRSLVEDRYGLEFRMDAAIMPRLDGDMMPLELRVDPQVAVDLEMASPDQFEKWTKVQQQSRTLIPRQKLYTCGAGVIGFHIDADARLLPCLLTTDVSYDLSEHSFAEGWKHLVETMQGQLAKRELECHACPDSVMCGWCPSYALLENGDANSKPEYLCELGRWRREKLEAKSGMPKV
jgi:radical SAM protein with 4Fe4S-binding SPASM domain